VKSFSAKQLDSQLSGKEKQARAVRGQFGVRWPGSALARVRGSCTGVKSFWAKQLDSQLTGNEK